MSAEDAKIKQLELRISLPVKFTSEVDEYRKKVKDMVEQTTLLAQESNLPESAIQREALKLFNEFREDQSFSKEKAKIKRQRVKENEEYYGGEPQAEGFLDQRRDVLDKGALEDSALDKVTRKKTATVAERASQASIAAGAGGGGREFKKILGKQSAALSKGSNLARTATTGGIGGLISSVPGLGFILNNPLTQVAGAALALNEIYKYVVKRYKSPGQPGDPRYIFRLVEQAVSERFRSRDTQAALRFGEQNIIATQQQGFHALDIGLTRNTLQDVVNKGAAEIGLRGAGVR